MTIQQPTNQLGWRADLLQDWSANAPDLRGRLVMVLFRLANRCSRSRRGLTAIPAVSVGLVYRGLVEWVLGIEIPWKTSIGPGTRLRHGVGLVINDDTVIGSGVMLRHGVTIGNTHRAGPCPTIEDHVEIGAGAVIVGGITIGESSVIGANAVVTMDVPAQHAAVGNPAVIKPIRR